MKSYLICLMAAMFMLSACSKKSNNNTTVVGTGSATINGKAFTATQVGGISGIIGGYNDLTINIDDGTTFIFLDFWTNGNTTAGNYPITLPPVSSPNVSTATYNPTNIASNDKYAAYGSINIANIASDGTITGSFNFTTTDSVHVTGGSFKVKPL